MKTKSVIGIIAVVMLMASAGTSDAAKVHKRAVEKIVASVGKACDSVASFLWRNKETVALCTAVVVAVSAPEAVVQGAATVAAHTVQCVTAAVTSGTEAVVKSAVNPGSELLTLLLLVALFIAGLWLIVGCIRRKYWRVLPVLVLAVLVFSGVAHAGLLECGFARPPVWWGDIVGIILLLIALFIP